MHFLSEEKFTIETNLSVSKCFEIIKSNTQNTLPKNQSFDSKKSKKFHGEINDNSFLIFINRDLRDIRNTIQPAIYGEITEYSNKTILEIKLWFHKKVRWVFILWFLINTAVGIYLIYEMILESKFSEVFFGPIINIVVVYILISKYPKLKKNAKEELIKTFKSR